MKKALVLLLIVSTLLFTFFTKPLSVSAKCYTLSTPKIISITEGHNCNIIKWNKIYGAEKYRVFLRVGNRWKAIGNTSSTTYKAKVNGKIDTDNQYTVRCISADGKRYTSDFDPIGYYCHHRKAPVFLDGHITKDNKGIWFSWSALNLSYGGKYRIFIRRSDGSWKKLKDVTSTSCSLLKSQFCKKEYYYKINTSRGWAYVYSITVRAVDANGNYTSDYADDITDLCLSPLTLKSILTIYYL